MWLFLNERHQSGRWTVYTYTDNALADLAQEPFAQCSPWDIAVGMLWQAAGPQNTDAARRFAAAPFQQVALFGGRHLATVAILTGN